MTAVRFPLDPLESQLRLRYDAPTYRAGDRRRSHLWSDEVLALMLDVDRRTICRWRQTGLGVYATDRAAVHIGLHPVLVWPDWHPPRDPGGAR